MAETELRFKDVRVSKGSDLAQALEDKDHLQAERIYWQCEVEFQKWAEGAPWEKPEGLAEKKLKEILVKIEAARLKKEKKHAGNASG